MTYRALRRTFATEFQRHGSPKDAQAQLRHSKLEMTGWYMREIPESVRSAVAEMDAEICQSTETNAPSDTGGHNEFSKHLEFGGGSQKLGEKCY
jgi:hypothetical protein